jgi:hypothetical protein
MFPLCAVAAAVVLAQLPVHDKPYWQAIVRAKFELPVGETAPRLAGELVTHLGSPDPELRDDLAATILTSWIYDKKLLNPDELRPLVLTLRQNLRQNIEAPDTDATLLRSFSALALSIVAARENVTPFMTDAEYAALLESALTYLHDERDTRGYDGERGWIHTAAHTADLLKFLARSSKLPQTGQARILEAVLSKNRDARAPFTQGEDERMARAVISIVRRDDFDRTAFTAWLGAAKETASFPKTPTVAQLRAQQNVRHLLAALWTELSVDDRPSAGADFARIELKDTLKKLY